MDGDIDAKGEGNVSEELLEDEAPKDARIILRKRSGTACAMEQPHKRFGSTTTQAASEIFMAD